MSSSKKASGQPRFLSAGKQFQNSYGNLKNESYAQVSDSLLHSLAYCTAPNREKQLLIIAIKKKYGYKQPYDDDRYKEIVGNRRDVFFLSLYDVTKEYHLYTEKGSSQFYHDVKDLIKRGFIERIYSGKGRGGKSIYCFSDKWIEWKPEPP